MRQGPVDDGEHACLDAGVSGEVVVEWHGWERDHGDGSREGVAVTVFHGGDAGVGDDRGGEAVLLREARRELRHGPDVPIPSRAGEQYDVRPFDLTHDVTS